MGLFNLIKSKKGFTQTSPVKGECIPIGKVTDMTFSEEILGKGIAIKPSDGKIYAPADGVVNTVFPTGHAVGISTLDGVEILIHVGIDTVELRGKYFKSMVIDDQIVHKGELLLEADIEEISKAGYDTVTLMVVCNSNDFTRVECKTKGAVEVGEEVITCIK
jgi:glucose-specific phosphotransferase system IIA component